MALIIKLLYRSYQSLFPEDIYALKECIITLIEVIEAIHLFPEGIYALKALIITLIYRCYQSLFPEGIYALKEYIIMPIYRSYPFVP